MQWAWELKDTEAAWHSGRTVQMLSGLPRQREGFRSGWEGTYVSRAQWGRETVKKRWDQRVKGHAEDTSQCHRP